MTSSKAKPSWGLYVLLLLVGLGLGLLFLFVDLDAVAPGLPVGGSLGAIEAGLLGLYFFIALLVAMLKSGPGIAHAPAEGDTRYKAGLAGASQLITAQRQLPPDEFLGRSLAEAVRITGASGGSLEVVEGDSITYRLAAGQAPPNAGRQPIRGSLAGECVTSRKPVRVDDAAREPRVRVGANPPPYGSSLLVPVLYGDRVLGLVRVIALTPSHFQDSDAMALEPVCTLLGQTLWRAGETEATRAAEAERSTAVTKARSLEERFSLLSDHLGDVFWITDPERNECQYVNAAYESVFGRPTDTLLRSARAWYDAVVPEDRDRVLKASLAGAKEGRYEIEYRIARPDRSLRWIREVAFPIKGPDRKLAAVAALARDVTEARKVQEAAQALERRTGFALERGPVVVYAAKPGGDFGLTFVSPNVEEMLDHRAGELLQDPNFWSAHLHPDDQSRVFADFPKLFEKGRLEHEYRFKHADGTYRILRDEMTLLRDKDGHPVEIVGYWVDVTERKRTEEGVQYSLNRIKELQESRTRLLNNISHDLASPITPIRLQLFMLKKTLGEQEGPAKTALEVVTRNVEQLTHLIEDLKDVARLEAGKLKIEPQKLDLVALVKGAAESFQPSAKERGVNLELHVGKSLKVNADPQRVNQVLFNFITNALKFTPKGGTIALHAAKEKESARVRVVDSGRGLSADEMDRLFKPFSQVHNPGETTEKGTGLGLFICKGLIESHGGRVFVESAGHGKGSTFGFVLPIVES